jgi:hypothetical protein
MTNRSYTFLSCCTFILLLNLCYLLHMVVNVDFHHDGYFDEKRYIYLKRLTRRVTKQQILLIEDNLKDNAS